MKKIFESKLNVCGNDTQAERIHVYAFDNKDEWWEFIDMSHEDKCEYFGIYEHGEVAPGERYYCYDFEVTSAHLIMSEQIAYNV